MAERVFLNHPSIPLGCHVVFYDHWSVWMKDFEASKTSSVSISVAERLLSFRKVSISHAKTAHANSVSQSGMKMNLFLSQV